LQGNFNLFLGRDWIHANQCVPSTLHQLLIQGISNEVEVVHGDTSSFVAMADSNSIGAHDNIKGFVSAVLKPMDNQLNLLIRIK
jgi:hypothetical protein